jgi:hypothetical protein
MSSEKVRTTVTKYLASGLSVIPIQADGSKSPALGSWKQFQEKLPSQA